MVWSTEERNTYNIKIEHVYCRSPYQDKLDNIIVVDCKDRERSCQMSLTVGKTYTMATRIEHDKDNDKKACKLRDLCYSWYEDF